MYEAFSRLLEVAFPRLVVAGFPNPNRLVVCPSLSEWVVVAHPRQMRMVVPLPPRLGILFHCYILIR